MHLKKILFICAALYVSITTPQTKQTNTLSKEVIDKLEYDLITWKAHNNTVKSIRNMCASLTVISIAAFIWNRKCLQKSGQDISFFSIPNSMFWSDISMKAFGINFIVFYLASYFRNRRIQELEKFLAKIKENK